MKPEKHEGHLWKKDDQGRTDHFAFDHMYCNGPECLICGYSFCEHCHPEGYESKCSEYYYTCGKCGQIVSDGDNYCSLCGEKIER